MGSASKHFDWEEFQVTAETQTLIDFRLVRGLQELRYLAQVPIHINSGYRDPDHNLKVGGTRNSLHCTGKAADIVIEGHTPPQMYALAAQIAPFAQGGIGIYTWGVHVDVRETYQNRGVRWGCLTKDGGYVDFYQALYKMLRGGEKK
jgi:uncharacterized protein YcbK (DUF882 family)